MKWSKAIFIAVLVLNTQACFEGKYGSMSKVELLDKKRHCDSIPKKSAVFANGCEQVKKEIARRNKK